MYRHPDGTSAAIVIATGGQAFSAGTLDHEDGGTSMPLPERKGGAWLPETLWRNDLAALEGDPAAEGQGALIGDALAAAVAVREIDLPAFPMADLAGESTTIMAAD